ncbi:MAG: Ig-like domain-containing protein, partial [Acidimicrobiia bacterium]
ADAGGSGVALVAFQRSPAAAGTWTQIGTDAVSPFATNLDTTALGDGQYDLRAVTTDAAGNTFTSAAITVRIDNTDPTGSVTAPADAANVRDTVTLASDSADGGSGVDTVQFQRSPIGAGTWTNQAASWNTTAQTDGQYDLRVITTDVAGNSFTSATITVRVDNTLPTGAVTAPTDGASVRSTVSLTSNSADAGGSGVDSVQFQRSPASAGAWTNQAASWDTTAQADGQYDVRVVTTDLAGNVFTSSAVTVTVDNTAPNTTITANPADPSNTDAPSFSFSSSEGSSTFEVRIDGGAWTASTSPKSYTGVADGAHTFQVRATDAAGNVDATPDSYTWVVDTTNPTGSVTAPTDAANVRGTITLTSNSADAGGSGVATVQFQRSPIGAGTWTNQAASWNTTAVSDGQYDLRVTTTDAAGNSFTSATITVRVDNTDPTGSVTAPADAANVRGTITLTSNSADAGGSGVDTVQFQLSPIGAGTWTNQAASWNTTGVSDGQYDLRVVTTDLAGNIFTSATITVRVDNTNPTGSVTAPADAEKVRATVGLTSNSADAGGSGVATVQFQRSPATAGTWTNQAASWDTTAQADGLYDVRVVTTDNAGNSLTSSVVTVTVDNTAPNTTITANPADPSNTSAPSFSFTSTEGGSTFEVRLDGGSWSASTTPKTYSGLAEGSHTFDVRATDEAGNQDASAATYTWSVDTTNPTGSVTAPAASARVRATVAITSDSADTGGSGVGSVTLQRSAAGAGSWTAIGSDSFAPYSVDLDTTALTDGSDYDLRAITTDLAGNPYTSAVVTVTVDNTVPNTTITANPADPTNATGASFSFTSTEAGGTFECRIDGGSWSACSSPKTYAGLGEGSHTFDVRATDIAGNQDASAASYTWTIDTSAPNTTITANPADPTNATGA